MRRETVSSGTNGLDSARGSRTILRVHEGAEQEDVEKGVTQGGVEKR